jgi:2-hydroxychromene-2-carboxylate isomerase
MENAKLEFWYEFASTYSYLSALRIEDLANSRGVDIIWRPFLLGPIFHAQGWTSSPFNIYPAKGRYMVRDITRIATARGLAFKMPEVFPANGLQAARIAYAGVEPGWAAHFTRCVYAAQFAGGKNIADPALLRSILSGLGLDPDEVVSTANSTLVKDGLRAQTTRAIELGIFGAPSFTTPDGELFWGDDRLELALDWTLTHQAARSRWAAVISSRALSRKCLASSSLAKARRGTVRPNAGSIHSTMIAPASSTLSKIDHR